MTLFDKIKDPNHCLNKLLPQLVVNIRQLRHPPKFADTYRPTLRSKSLIMKCNTGQLYREKSDFVCI